MNLLIFQNPYEFFQFFLRLWKYRFRKKNWGYYRATVGSITQKILVSDIESFNRNISKIRNVTFNFQNLKNNSQKRKKIGKIHMDFEISINSFEIKKR